jgi:hypothetical protein
VDTIENFIQNKLTQNKGQPFFWQPTKWMETKEIIVPLQSPEKSETAYE